MIGQEENVNGPMDMTISSLLWNIFSNRCNMKDQPKEHAFWQRLMAAFFGCLALHLSLFVIVSGGLYQAGTILSGVGIASGIGILLTYSLIFSSIVASGSPKGTVIRHFAYGVFLPTITYIAAGYIIVVAKG